MAGSGRSDGIGSRSAASCSTMAEAEEQSEGREEREREKERKSERARFDRGKLKIFELNLKSFEYQSCSLCRNLQLWFQTFSHLRLGLKVKNSNSSLNENPINLLFFGFFSKFHVVT